MADVAGSPERDLSDETMRTASAVTAYARYPHAVVSVVRRGSAEWDRYAATARRLYVDTDRTYDLMRKGLISAVSKEDSPLWRSRRGLVEAFDHRSPAEYAVVADAGGDGRLFTVATIVRSGEDLRVVGAGTSHPGIADPSATQSDVPGPDEMGRAVWYAINGLATKEGRSVLTQVPSSTWRGPEVWRLGSADRLNLVSRTGDLSTGSDPRWSAAEVRQHYENVTRLQPNLTNPFRAVERPLGDETSRHVSVAAADFFARGGSIEVYDHGVQSDLDQAELAALPVSGTSQWQGLGARTRLPGVRTLVAALNGTSVAAATLSRSADGRIRYRGSDGPPGGTAVLRLAAWAEGVRLGAEVVNEATGGSWTVSKMTDLVAETAEVVESRMDEFRAAGWRDAGQPGADPGTVAESVARTRAGRDLDVVIFEAGLPEYVSMKEKVDGMVAEARRDQPIPAQRDGTATPAVMDERLAGLSMVFDPQAGADGKTIPPGTAVAVAVDEENNPLAAVAFRDTGHRIEIGPVGSRPDAGSDVLNAVIVDGVYRAADGRPVGGYLPASMADAYRAAGARIDGASAVDAEWLTGVEVSAPLGRQLAAEADRLAPGAGPDELRRFAANLREFASSDADIAVLDHADPNDRRRAEHVHSVLAGVQGDDRSGPGSATDNLHRVTVAVVDGGEPRAFVTVDSRPGQPITVIDASPPADAQHEAALRWWLANHQARLGRPMQESEAVLRARHGEGADPGKGVWEPAETRYLISGVHNRLQDRMDILAEGAGSEFPGRNGQAVRLPSAPAPGEAREQPDADRPRQARAPDRFRGGAER